ncbi:hypothetical protein [Sphingomonas sp. Root241]|uniref:hypothetical protein n=1 Tax=Sphingomonas sp. Root241 TaxID=1736501 RepID=UPI0012E36DD5|nr:hypothetical protein [Sphingomonas sp. Root241]
MIIQYLDKMQESRLICRHALARQSRIVRTHVDARPRKRSEATRVSKGDLL